MGFGFGHSGQNQAMIFSKLRDFDERTDAKLSASAIAGRANAKFERDRAGRILIVQPPAFQGLGNSSGFSMYLLDQSGAGTAALFAVAENLIDLAEADGRATGLRTGASGDDTALKPTACRRATQWMQWKNWLPRCRAVGASR